MDVRAKNRGRPHQKVRLSAAPVMGRDFLTQGRPGVRVRNVRGKSGPKSLCLCCFFSSLKSGKKVGFWTHFHTLVKRCLTGCPRRAGDSQTVICKPCSENSWTNGWKWGAQSRSARNSLKSPFSQSPPDGLATLKVRKSAFDALNKGSGALGRSEVKLSPLRGAPWRTLWTCRSLRNDNKISRQ